MRGDELVLAGRRARRLYPNPRSPFRRPYMAGARARLAGRPIDACPYKRDPYKTWRRTWRSAWIAGWESVVIDEDE